MTSTYTKKAPGSGGFLCIGTGHKLLQQFEFTNSIPFVGIDI